MGLHQFFLSLSQNQIISIGQFSSNPQINIEPIGGRIGEVGDKHVGFVKIRNQNENVGVWSVFGHSVPDDILRDAF